MLLQRDGCVSLAHTSSRFLPGKSQERLEDLQCGASLAEAPKADGSSVCAPFLLLPTSPTSTLGQRKRR